MNLVELKKKNISELINVAKSFKIEGAPERRRGVGDSPRRVRISQVTGFELSTRA
jgi:hypothetical protein